MDISKENEQTTDAIINVDSPSVPCRSKNICSQSAHEQSMILIESSQKDIPDIPTHTKATNNQSVPLKTSAGEMNSAGIKYIPLAGNPDTIFVNFPSHLPSLGHTYGSKLVEPNNEVSQNLKESSSKVSMNDKNKEQGIPKLIPDYDSESDHTSGQEQTSPVFGTSYEQGKKKLSMKFMETFMQPMPAAQKFLLDGKGLLQSEVSMKEFDANATGIYGNSLKSGSICYPKISSPDLNDTAMSENTSSDVTTSNSDPSSRTSQQTSSESKSTSSSDPTAAESSLDKDDPIQDKKPVISADNSYSEQDNDSNDEALTEPDDNAIDDNSDVQKETNEDLLLGNGDKHPNAAQEHINSDIEMELLKGDQADYEGGDKGINESKDSAQRRKVLKSPTIRNQVTR